MFTEKYNLLFTKNLEEFISSNGIEKNVEYTLLYPDYGEDYFKKKKLMIVGRAASKWFVNFKPSDLINNNDKILEKVNESINLRVSNRLVWAQKEWNGEVIHENGRKLTKFRFWQVPFQIYKKLDGEAKSNSWFQNVAWSNIYKITPNSRGVNPNKKEREIQVKNNMHIELLRNEIEFLQPEICLMMIDENWAKDIINILNLESTKKEFNKTKITHLISQYKSTTIIITSRPDKRGKGLTNDSFVNEVYENILMLQNEK